MEKYAVYKKLHEIAKENNVTLQSMAVIEDVDYLLRQDYNAYLSDEDIEELYELILKYDNELAYEEKLMFLEKLLHQN